MSHAVFDFDGTLIDGDSTTRWLLDMFGRSPLRLALALLVLPIALPMVLVPSTCRRGASTFLWIATLGLDEPALERSVRAFAGRFRAGELSLRFRSRGVETLERHLADGHRVAIATAAPALVARALLKPWEANIAVVGSALGRVAGGWVFRDHCYGWAKCRFLRDIGYPDSWQYAYTDSIADEALLVNAAHGFVINPGRILRARAAKIAAALAW